MRTQVICLLLLGLSCPPRTVAQFVRAEGKAIVDTTGNPIVLRGLGLGGWLVPEGYMLHTPGYGSPTSIRNMIQDLIGEQDTKTFFDLYRANYVNERDIARISTWGFNSIRLPFHYDLISPVDQPGVFREEGFQVLDSLITWCKRYGMYVILDMHCAPGGQNPNNISDSDGEAKLWTMATNQDRTVEIWKKIAARYAHEPAVAGYDLLNEPVLPAGYTNSVLRSFFRRLALALREVDAQHLLFIEGNNFATDFRDLTPPLVYGTNIAYSFHKYWNETTQASIQDYLNLRDNWNVPLWMGESGENSNPWFYEAIKLFEKNDIGWCWWTHKKMQTTTSPLSATLTPEYQRLLDYWNGQASRPSAAIARDALWGQAQNLALEKCEPRPDVLHAIFDPAFNMRPQAFVPHQIPGIINCSDYDLGNVNIAYYDQDYQKLRWDADQPWNTGREYRNDGVDIEKSRDANGAPYSVGWIASGEWLKYSVTVTQAGQYEVVFRIASGTGGGVLKLLLDGQEVLGAFTLPKTQAWYDWRAVKAENIHLPAGEHVLMLFVTKEGFNINRMEFVFTSPAAIDDKSHGRIINRYELQQSYPNPLVRTAREINARGARQEAATIDFFLPRPAQVSLKVYEVSGREVCTVLDGAFEAGPHAGLWHGTDAKGHAVPAGVYLYILESGQERLARKLLLVQ